MSKIRPGIKGLYDALAMMALQGIRVKPGSFGKVLEDPQAGEQRCRVCLCGAVLVACGMPVPRIQHLANGEKGPWIIQRVAKKLRITVDQAISLNNGFEGIYPSRLRAHGADPLEAKRISLYWYRIGKSMRRHYEKGGPC